MDASELRRVKELEAESNVEHGWPVLRSCESVGLSRPVWYQPPLDPAVRDAAVVAKLSELVQDRPSRGFQVNVIDDFNRQALHTEIDTSITYERPIRVFEQIQAEHGLPQVLCTDNGPEFLGEAFVPWARAHGMAIHYILPGKPNQNAYIERFNRTYREEVLDQHPFTRLDDVREATWDGCSNTTSYAPMTDCRT